jgi:hypothetical protein
VSSSALGVQPVAPGAPYPSLEGVRMPAISAGRTEAPHIHVVRLDQRSQRWGTEPDWNYFSRR